jgi:hypothetical protein
MQLGPPEKAQPKLTAKKSADGKSVVLSLPGRPLGTAELGRLEFLTRTGPVKDTEKRVLVSKAKPVGDAWVFPHADLVSMKIAKIDLDGQVVDVPK